MKFVIKKLMKEEYLQGFLINDKSYLTCKKENEAWLFLQYAAAKEALDKLNDKSFKIVNY